ncbi:MAG: hypothetical protein ABJP48_09745 [Erythrobacter sp.]
MKSLNCILALGLCGCAMSPTLSYAPRDLDAGYPVFITGDGSDCHYQVQDMLVSRKQLSEWMQDLPDKSWQVDLVVADGGEACAMRVHRIVNDAGFARIAYRKGGDVVYPSGLPPA